MQLPDMNLLPALDALLREGSVAGAAAELQVSPSAMSRTLGRLRRVVGDPLLVPSGRGLALTPRARELQPQVQSALAGALTALRPPQPVELATLEREFMIRTNDSMAVSLGSALVAEVTRQAPGVRLRMLPEGDENISDLRTAIDLDLGPLPQPLPPDFRSSTLGHCRYVAVTRADAPFAARPLTAKRFAALPHITATRRGQTRTVVDEALAGLGLARDVLATVPTYMTACLFTLDTDALALVPEEFAHEAARTLPLTVLEIPLELPTVRVDQTWHIRVDTDPGHQWLRSLVARLYDEIKAGQAAR
ncbi:LysR family transcriptional regulator [Streptomyces sp. NBC_01304]|uniref:LysR family transcriptional regulator n=1 Tax=Streptomyces sp. NBC_01304 TaxID=2903818 RepID=UPI002E0E92AE|nr:LysR family transcriptional regulator [Streptomyces sp. NBC_01304]